MTTASRVSRRLAVVALVAVCAAVGATGVAQAAGRAIRRRRREHGACTVGAPCRSERPSSTSGFALVGSTWATSWTSASLSSATYWYEVAAAYGSTWVSPRSVATASYRIVSASPYCS